MRPPVKDWINEQIDVCEGAINQHLAVKGQDRSQFVMKLAREMKAAAKALSPRSRAAQTALARRLVAKAGPARPVKIIGMLGTGSSREPSAQMLYDLGALLGGIEPLDVA